MAQITGANLNDETLDAWGGESVQLPPGPYSFEIKDADIESKEKDGETKLQLALNSEVISSGEMKGKTAKSWFNLDFKNEVSRKRLKSLVLATGIQLDAQGNFDTAQLKGCKYNGEVTHETYDGKPDPITGTAVKKTAIRIVNERPFAPLSAAPVASGVAKGGTVGGNAMPGLPGLSRT